MKKHRNPLLSYWHWAVLGAPLWWVLGFNIALYHLVALFLLMKMVHVHTREGIGVYLPKSAGYLFFIILFYLLSLALNARTSDAMRLLASIYNLSFWIMGLFLVIVISNCFSTKDCEPVLKTFVRLAWVIAIIAAGVLLLALTGVHTIYFQTPLYGLTRYLGHNTLVENTFSVILLHRDWLASTMFPRFNIFSPYSVAGGEVIMLVMIMLITHAGLVKKKRNVWFLLILASLVIAFLMTLSRMPLVAVIAAFVCLFLIRKKKPLIWIFLFVLILFIIYPWVDRLLALLLSMRQGSNIGRLELYRYSLQWLEGIEWVLGLGIKPREGGAFGVPIGSHSTYLSIIFRMGFAGLICFLLFQFDLLLRWYQLKGFAGQRRERFLFWQGLGWSFLAMVMCMMTDEIDVPQFLSFLYFSLVGMFEGLNRRREA